MKLAKEENSNEKGQMKSKRRGQRRHQTGLKEIVTQLSAAKETGAKEAE